MTFSLREYQRHTIDALRAGAIRICKAGEKKGLLAVLGTGAGKTVIAAVFMAEAILASKAPVRFLFNVHRRDLASQSARTFANILKLYGLGHVPVQVEMGEERATQQSGSHIVVATTQTLGTSRDGKLRLQKFPKDYFFSVFWDECHETVGEDQSLQVLAHFTHALNIGITATIDDEAAKKLAPFFESEPVVNYPYHVLRNEGWLCDFDVVDISSRIEIKGALAQDGRKLSCEDEAKILKDFTRDAARKLAAAVPSGEITLVSCPSISLADAFAAALGDAGKTAKSIHSKMPETEQAEVLAEFDRGEIQFFCICDKLRIGWDPKANLRGVAVFRVFKKWARFVQLAGRAARPWGVDLSKYATAEERKAALAASEKPKFTIYDLAKVFNGSNQKALTVGMAAALDPDGYLAAAEVKDVGASVDSMTATTPDERLQLAEAFDEAITACLREGVFSEEQAHAYLVDFDMLMGTLMGGNNDAAKDAALKRLRGLIKKLMLLAGVHDYSRAKSILKHLTKAEEEEAKVLPKTKAQEKAERDAVKKAQELIILSELRWVLENYTKRSGDAISPAWASHIYLDNFSDIPPHVKKFHVRRITEKIQALQPKAASPEVLSYAYASRFTHRITE